MLVIGMHEGEYHKAELLRLLHLIPAHATDIAISFDGGHTTFHARTGGIDMTLRTRPHWARGQLHVPIRGAQHLNELHRELQLLATERIWLHAQPHALTVRPASAAWRQPGTSQLSRR